MNGDEIMLRINFRSCHDFCRGRRNEQIQKFNPYIMIENCTNKGKGYEPVASQWTPE